MTSQYRCYKIKTCSDCPNRMEMYHLFKPYGMMVLPDHKESYDFHGRWVCNGRESGIEEREILCDLPEWCPLPAIKSNAKYHAIYSGYGV